MTVRDFGLSPEVVELADIGAGEWPSSPCRSRRECACRGRSSSTAVTMASSSSTGLLSVFATGPGHRWWPRRSLQIDLEPPVLQVCHIRCHDRSSKTQNRSSQNVIARRFSAAAIQKQAPRPLPLDCFGAKAPRNDGKMARRKRSRPVIPEAACGYPGSQNTPHYALHGPG